MKFLRDLWEYRSEDLIKLKKGQYSKVRKIINSFNKSYENWEKMNDTKTKIFLINHLDLENITKLCQVIKTIFELA